MRQEQLQAHDHPEMLRGIYRPIAKPEPRVTFQVERVMDCKDEVQPLIERHYQEIAQFKGVQKLDPDWEAYEALERSGRLWAMTVRADGALVGYIVMVVARSLHYKGLMMAMEDIHYLLPEYRKGLTGYRLLAKARQAMMARGVRLMTLRTKAGQSHAKLFERLGGELQDLVYAFQL